MSKFTTPSIPSAALFEPRALATFNASLTRHDGVLAPEPTRSEPGP